MPSSARLIRMHQGQMDATCLPFLINSISRFIHLVSCQTLKPMFKDYKNMVGLLKLLKSLLDEIVDLGIPLNEALYKESERLDTAVNEAREFLESWNPKMSKICSVLQSESLLMEIRSSSTEFCLISCKVPLDLSLQTRVQCCMQEIQYSKRERVTEHIEEAIRSQGDHKVPSSEVLSKIIESLNLTSSQELLKERVALEKEISNTKVIKVKGESYQMDQILGLVSHVRDFLVKRERFENRNGVTVPSYFCCPLSSELMFDPVIVASGQTYDRASIQKWFENGLTICPMTRQTLTHADVIPNYTVKAMIANWCDENNIRILSSSEKNYPAAASSPSYRVSSQDLFRTDSFCSPRSSSSTSRSSFEIANGIQRINANVFSRTSGDDETNGCKNRENTCNPQSPGQTRVYSRSESVSSVVSNVDSVRNSDGVLRASSKLGVSELREIESETPNASVFHSEFASSLSLSGKMCNRFKEKAEVDANGSLEDSEQQSLPHVESKSDDSEANSHVKKLVEDLKSQSREVQASAAEELRHLAKDNMDNRITIVKCGAIRPLLSLLYSEVKLTQEHAVTALLNLSINEKNKAMIAEAGAIEPLIHVLKSGTDGAKENSAAALFSLSLLEDFKAKIGRTGAVKALVDLLGSGTTRGKKDAATALFSLSIFHENKARIVQAGAIKYLVGFLDPGSEMVDKAVALLANLSTIEEGQIAISREGGIPPLVEIVESGSQRGKENAASTLLQLCLYSPKFCAVVLQEGAVPPLVALSLSGTARAKEKAQQLLGHFRNQREGGKGKGKSL